MVAMGQVDDFQAGEEFIAQKQEAEEQAAREVLHELLAAHPEHDGTAALVRHLEVIDVADITTGFNARADLTGIEDLAASIAQRGLHTPLEVRVDEVGRYVLISGHRRLAALRLVAEATGQPALARCEVVDDVSEADHFVLQLIENDVVPITPRDWARGIRKLMVVHPEWDAHTLARSIGKDVEFARKHLRLLDLPEGIRDRLERGDLSFTNADMLRKAVDAGRLDAEDAEGLAADVADGRISSAELFEAAAPAKPTANPALDRPDGTLDDWGDDEASVHWEAPAPSPADVEAQQAALAAQADALLAAHPEAGAEAGAGDIPDVPFSERSPAWALLDAYLLGRVAGLLDESVRAAYGVGSDPYAWADSLGVAERASMLRQLSQDLLRADESAPSRYDDALDIAL